MKNFCLNLTVDQGDWQILGNIRCYMVLPFISIHGIAAKGIWIHQMGLDMARLVWTRWLELLCGPWWCRASSRLWAPRFTGVAHGFCRKMGKEMEKKNKCKLQVWSCPMSWVCCLLFTVLKEDNRKCWTSLQIINFDISVEVDLNIGSTAVPLQGVSRLRVAKLSRCLGNVTGGWWYVWHPVIQPSSSYPAIEWCRKRFQSTLTNMLLTLLFSFRWWCWCWWWEGWGWCGLFDMSDDVIYLRDST